MTSFAELLFRRKKSEKGHRFDFELGSTETRMPCGSGVADIFL